MVEYSNFVDVLFLNVDNEWTVL